MQHGTANLKSSAARYDLRSMPCDGTDKRCFSHKMTEASVVKPICLRNTKLPLSPHSHMASGDAGAS